MEKDRSFNTTGLKSSILLISFIQMSLYGISSILSALTGVFSGVSDQQVQFLMTFPSIFITVLNLLSAKLSRYIPQKYLALTGLILVIISSILSMLFHSSITVLYVWSALMGIGLGLTMPVPTVAAGQYFEGQDRINLMGQFTTISNTGGILMSVLGGLFAVSAWYRVYFVYFLTIPGIICTFLFFPSERNRQDSNTTVKEKFRPDLKIIWVCILVFLFSAIYNAAPSNTSLIVAERSLGDSAVSGIMSAVLLGGGAVGGLLFRKIRFILKSVNISAGFIMMSLGFLFTGIFTTVQLIIVGFFLIGFGFGMIMPDINLMTVIDRKPFEIPVCSALMFASGNLGAFVSSFLTTLSAFITGSSAVHFRLITAAVITVLLACMTFPYSFIKKKRV
jgi:MFS family permease